MSEERFDQLEKQIDAVAGDLRAEMKQHLDDLGRQMRVLHEETIHRIAALAPDFGPIRRELSNADEKYT